MEIWFDIFVHLLLCESNLFSFQNRIICKHPKIIKAILRRAEIEEKKKFEIEMGIFPYSCNNDDNWQSENIKFPFREFSFDHLSIFHVFIQFTEIDNSFFVPSPLVYSEKCYVEWHCVSFQSQISSYIYWHTVHNDDSKWKETFSDIFFLFFFFFLLREESAHTGAK